MLVRTWLRQHARTGGLAGLALLVLAAGCESDRTGLKPSVGTDPSRPEPKPSDPKPEPKPDPDPPPVDAGVDVSGPAPSDGGAPERPPSHMGCAFGYHKAERVPPEIVLIFDRSSAMRKPVQGATNNRWVEMTEGVFDVLKVRTTTSWGLKLFPSGSDICIVSDPLDVPVGPAQFNTVIDKIRGSAPNMGNGTEGAPIAQALNQALTATQAVPSTKPRFFVLASDGVTSCPSDPAMGASAALRAMRTVIDRDVRTFVIGTAPAGSAANKLLNDLAVAGHEPNPGTTRYTAVTNKMQMQKALDNIAEQLSSCLYGIERDPIFPNNTAVTIGGQTIPRDDSQVEGWSYGASNRIIRFYGQSCARLRANPSEAVQMVFGCNGVTP